MYIYIYYFLLYVCYTFAIFVLYVCYIVAICLLYVCYIFGIFLKYGCYIFVIFLARNLNDGGRCTRMDGGPQAGIKRLRAQAL